MKRWEYLKRVARMLEEKDFIEMGLEGWELVCSSSEDTVAGATVYLIFKRELPPPLVGVIEYDLSQRP